MKQTPLIRSFATLRTTFSPRGGEKELERDPSPGGREKELDQDPSPGGGEKELERDPSPREAERGCRPPTSLRAGCAAGEGPEELA